MFKRKGGGVKGLLNNVKKNCTFLKERLPQSAKYKGIVKKQNAVCLIGTKTL